MRIKIQASHRLLADWFSDLSREAQVKYVREHPDSKHAEDYDNARDAEEPEEDDTAEQIADLKSQIAELMQDIKEARADGYSVIKEQRLLSSLREELISLS